MFPGRESWGREGGWVISLPAIDGGATALASMIVAEFFRDHLDSHLARTKPLLRQKRDTLLAALEAHWSGLGTWTRPNGGLFGWLSLPTVDYRETEMEDGLHSTLAGAPLQPGPSGEGFIGCDRPSL